MIPDSDSEEEPLPPGDVTHRGRSTNDVRTSHLLDKSKGSDDEDDEDVSLPRRPCSARDSDALEGEENEARFTNDARILQILDQNENSDNQDDEGILLPRKRRTARKSDTLQAEEHVRVEVPQRLASLPMQPDSLRRSGRAAALKSGPHAYSNRWHPIDDLKPSKTIKKKASQEKFKKSISKSAERSTSVTREKGNEREDHLQRDSKDIHERSAGEEKPSSHSPRRRSPRNVYNADVAMKYDMSSHWPSRRLLQPKAFAKKLEQKRRSIAPDFIKHKDLDVQSISTPSLSPHKPLKNQKQKPNDFGTKVDVNEEIHSIDSSRTTPPRSTRDNDEQNIPLSPGALPVSASHPDYLPMVLDEELVLHEQDPDLPPYSDAVADIPKGEDLYMQLLRPLPDRKVPEMGVKPLNWIYLTNFDRRLYTLQRGAPANGGALPLQWPDVQKMLVDEGYRKALGSMSDVVNISYIRARYEYIRLGVETFFKAEPEPEGKRDWTLFRFEDFDVFDCRQGRKYRKRSEDNVVKPVETAAEHGLPELQPCNLISDQEEPSRPLDDAFLGKTEVVANEIRTQNASALDTQQIDEFLALADPCEDIDSLLPLTSPQQLHNSITTGLQDLEHPPDGVNDDQAAHELSEKSLMEVMQTTQPASFNGTSAEKQAEVEAFLAGVPWSQELCVEPLPRPPEQAEKIRSSIKRRKRNTAADFFSIHEDDTADEDVTRIEVQNRQCGQKREQHLDLPVENMTAGELVPGSQERRAVSTPRRIRYRTDGVSHGHPLQTSIWVDGDVQTSIFGGSHPWVVSGFSPEG